VSKTSLGCVLPLALLTGCPSGTLTITTTMLPAGNVDSVYRVPVETAGGAPPLHFEVSRGVLQLGLELDADTGELRGTPAEWGYLSFAVRASDAGGAAAEQALTLNVFQNPPPRITTSSLLNAVVGRPYSLVLQALDGKSPYEWSLGQGSLPGGLKLEANGVLDGSATVAGASQVELVATDKNAQQARATFSIAAYPEVTLAPAQLPDATAGAPYAVTIQAAGGVPPYHFSLGGGSLPSGLSLDDGGHLAGTPAAAGSWACSVQVRDQSGQAPSIRYTLLVR